MDPSFMVPNALWKLQGVPKSGWNATANDWPSLNMNADDYNNDGELYYDVTHTCSLPQTGEH